MTKYEKNQEIVNIYEIIIACVEFFNELMNKEFAVTLFSKLTDDIIIDLWKFIDDYFIKLTNLFNYANKQLSVISGTYNLMVIQIKTTNFDIKKQKFALSHLHNN